LEGFTLAQVKSWAYEPINECKINLALDKMYIMWFEGFKVGEAFIRFSNFYLLMLVFVEIVLYFLLVREAIGYQD